MAAFIIHTSEPPTLDRRWRLLDLIHGQSNDAVYMHPIPN